MNFNPVFMFMHPREIPWVMESVKSVVNIPRVWFKAYDELRAMEMMNTFVENTNYTHYIISSDDAIVYKKSFDACLKYGSQGDARVFTGYCNISLEMPLTRREDGRERRVLSNQTNVYDKPLRLGCRTGPVDNDYTSWLTFGEVLNKGGLFRQYMAGMAITCYPREILLEFPLGVYPSGFSSDHHISHRLHKAGIQIWTHPDAFLLHLKPGWNPLTRDLSASCSCWTVYNKQPKVVLELDVSKHEVMSDEINAKYHLEELRVEVVR